MAPLILSCSQAGAADGRYGARAYALGELQPAEFGNVVRKTLTGFAYAGFQRCPRRVVANVGASRRGGLSVNSLE